MSEDRKSPTSSPMWRMLLLHIPSLSKMLSSPLRSDHLSVVYTEGSKSELLRRKEMSEDRKSPTSSPMWRMLLLHTPSLLKMLSSPLRSEESWVECLESSKKEWPRKTRKSFKDSERFSLKILKGLWDLKTLMTDQPETLSTSCQLSTVNCQLSTNCHDWFTKNIFWWENERFKNHD